MMDIFTAYQKIRIELIRIAELLEFINLSDPRVIKYMAEETARINGMMRRLLDETK